MRLWSLHPSYLDPKGLVALWREGLLAKAVIANQTKGYRNHPQLLRFQAATSPTQTIDAYLWEVHDEAARRGYRFDGTKLTERIAVPTLTVTAGQLQYEYEHLVRKVQQRAPTHYQQIANVPSLAPHPLFLVIDGAVEHWERLS